MLIEKIKKNIYARLFFIVTLILPEFELPTGNTQKNIILNIYFIFLSTVRHKITHDCTITRFTYYLIKIICSLRNNVIHFIGWGYYPPGHPLK
jgi:hypothetical protein